MSYDNFQRHCRESRVTKSKLMNKQILKCPTSLPVSPLGQSKYGLTSHKTPFRRNDTKPGCMVIKCLTSQALTCLFAHRSAAIASASSHCQVNRVALTLVDLLVSGSKP